MIRVFFKYFIPFLLLSGLIFSAIKHDLENHTLELRKKIRQKEVNQLVNIAEDRLNFILRDSRFVAAMVDGREFDFTVEQDLERLKKLIAKFMMIEKAYDQIRFFDLQGMEVFRADFRKGKVEFVSQENLQDKRKVSNLKKAKSISLQSISTWNAARLNSLTDRVCE